ncbi:TonB-dependent receptor [Dysgonomonas sp. ZJ709]|uniref:SusC/RagA family TonB-linked outer membrane protein n=1 Tax=Dysgonomonas sp. ZJ709 TaxID=2709797 RepID=UPI002104A068|nr:TonB-dependent receptor [Dysgonomonas sp. ZJ709]
MKKRVMLILSCLFLSIGFIAAQTRTSGIVVDDMGEAVIGASVVVKGTTVGTITDVDGKFTINVPEGRNILVFSLIGMQKTEVLATSNMRVVMENDDQTLDDVVVVGYGTQKKKDVTSAISKVGGSDISGLAAPSFDTQLAGRAAGVQVVTPGGAIGAAPIFKIRGVSTISSESQPLIIIDGAPVTSGEKQQLYGRFNPLADINPNDIESIEILKDGAATAIYGSRAANGVVLITTKKGSRSSTKVTYDGYGGFANATRTHKLLGARDFVTIANEKMENWGEKGQAVYDPSGPNTNWNDYIYQTGFQHSHTIGASGGTDKSQYYFSVGYTNQEGIVRRNDLERYSVKADLTQDATKWLKIGINVQANQTEVNGVMNEENSLGSVGFAGVRMLPNVAVFNPEDPTGYNIDAIERKALGRGSNLSPIDNGIQNIIWALDNNANKSKSTRVLGGGFAEIKFMEGLTLRTQANMDLFKLNDFMSWSKESGDGYGYGGVLEEINTTYSTWNWQNVLNYMHTFNRLHNFSATAVQEYTKTTYEWTDASVNGLSDGFFSEHIISNTFKEKDVGGYKSSNGLASYLVRANYNYDSKYYLGASLRTDGLSRLPEDNRWGTFFGASTAWRLSRESFWLASPIAQTVSDLRLRASYATLGNSELGSDFPYLGTYAAKLYGGQNGIAWNNMGNNTLKWESTETFDLGIDGSLFNSRLSFEFAYWQKTSKDLVLEVPTGPSLGIPLNRYYDNIGKIKNSGIELTIGGTIIDNSQFKWIADVNFSTLSNTVQSLYGGADIIDDYTIIREGQSFKSLYGYDYYGVNKTNGNPIWRKGNGTLVQFDTFGSDYDYKVYDPQNPSDVSQSSSLSAVEDRKVLGSSIPTWFGGFNNTFTYNDFDLNVFFRFSGGNKIMNGTRQSSLLNMQFANNGNEILGRWQSVENPGDGKTPRIGYGDSDALFNAGFTDSHFVEDGSFLRLSNITLGYSMPKNILSGWDMSKLRFYVQAQNLLTITGYSGLDPETSTRSGVDWDGLPQQRIFTLGAQIVF